MALSDRLILEHIEKGNIIIDPFDERNLGTSSYDVALGMYFYREKDPQGNTTVFNPYSENGVKCVWGNTSYEATPAGKNVKKYGLEGMAETDLVIWVNPGETILAHTIEFIGGRNILTSEMKARSSAGRSFIEVCKCAGWGDVGYINRWTMEITNNSRYYKIPLVVGRRIAQMVFYKTGPIRNKSFDYSKTGKYQNTRNIDELKKNWHPKMMLPRMYLDREVIALSKSKG